MTARFRVQVEPGGFCFESEGGLTLLESAQRAGILLPSSCRNGTCRTCMCHARGTARHVIEWPGLSREEKQEGYILPCVAHATSDLVLTVPAARRINL